MKLYDEKICARAEKILSQLTLREKIGQMVMFNSRNVKMLRDKYSYEEIAEKFPFGSFFSGCDVIGLVGKRMKGIDDVKAINEHSKLPLLVAGDLENGAGGEPMPCQIVLGATHDLKLAYDFGRVIAQRGRSEGFHWTFAPVGDIILNWLAPAIGMRALGSDPEFVADMCCEIIRGMQSNGLFATLKHFPGDGADFRNQHIGVAVDDMSKEEWDRTFGVVYRKTISAGVASIMGAHISLPCVDDRNFPSILSDKITTGLLRDELQFDGVLVTDALIMGGFVSFRPYEKRMITMVNAGCDVLLWPEPDIFDLLEKAVAAGDVKESRIDEAALRALKMKVASGILDENPPVAKDADDYQLVADTIAEKGIVLACDRTKVLPLDKDKVKEMLVVVVDTVDNLKLDHLEDDPRIKIMLDGFRERGAHLTIRANGNCLDLFDEELRGVHYDAIVMLFPFTPYLQTKISGTPLENVWQMSNTLHTNPVVVSLCSPYIATENPNTPAAVVNVCSHCPASQRAAVKAIYGEIPFTGKSPVDLKLDGFAMDAWDEIHYNCLEK
ncbi:MAG: hypothetical protein MJ033_08275 [Victivallaceae bacterium]|nr:hypothetical protein [Victivallaceae bacterium]